jgi:hypothetical protein
VNKCRTLDRMLTVHGPYRPCMKAFIARARVGPLLYGCTVCTARVCARTPARTIKGKPYIHFATFSGKV